VQFAQRLLSTRGGTIALSLMAAVLAAVILITYLNRYRDSVKASSVPVDVLVAKGVIEAGTSGEVIASQSMYQISSQAKGDVSEGAITDPATLKGRVATADIFPGEQLTTAKLTVSESTSLSNSITEDQRAITLPMDSSRGMTKQLQVGDHVDLYGGFNVQAVGRNGVQDSSAPAKPIVKLIIPDVQVLAIPSSGGSSGSSTSQVTLRLTDQQAAEAAYASDNGILWVTLRPKANAAPSSPDIVTIETLLFDVPPVRVYKALGGQQ
jgi:Flp pilus assembly protein CpaB